MKARNSLYMIALLSVAIAFGVGCQKPSRSDSQLAGEIQSKIGSDSTLQGRQIGTQVANGVATLNGTVNSDAERIAASNDAGSIDGVRQVLNNLSVQAAQQQPAPVQQAPAEVAAAPASRPSAARPRNHDHDYDSSKNNSANNSGSTMANNNAPMTPAPLAPSVAQQTTPPPPPVPKRVSIPDGTTLSVRLLDGLDSEKNQVGDTFRASLNSPITIEDNVVVPEGADLEGRVTQVQSATHFKGASMLAFELTKLMYNGHSYPIQTSRWSKQGTARGTNTAAKVGGGAAIGAVIGAIAGGGKGAAIGSVVGAGAGTTAQAVTKGEQIKLNPEALVSMTLQDSVTVTASPNLQRDRNRQRLPVPTDNSSNNSSDNTSN